MNNIFVLNNSKGSLKLSSSLVLFGFEALKTNKVISFDIAEVSPRFDQDHITARLASTLIFAVVNSVAELKGMDAEV